MIFVESNKIDKEINALWHYSGKCKDEKGVVWCFYTNDGKQFNEFKKKGTLFGNKFIDGKRNDSYKTIIKLLGD